MALTKVYEVRIRRGQVVVDVDRYTFVFVIDGGAQRCLGLTEISGQVHGKRDTRIERGDQVAKHARREARDKALVELRNWLREHPAASVGELVNQTIWNDPSFEPVTPEQRAANLAALDQLTATLAKTLAMPGTHPPQSSSP